MAERISIIAANSLLGGLKTALDLGFMYIYSGSQPTTPEDAANGTLLATISISGGATGLTWDTPADNEMEKVSSAVWSGTAVASGTAGWCRVSGASDTSPGAASTTEERVDMVCTRTGSSECILSTLTIVSGGSVTVDSAKILMPVA